MLGALTRQYDRGPLGDVFKNGCVNGQHSGQQGRVTAALHEAPVIVQCQFHTRLGQHRQITTHENAFSIRDVGVAQPRNRKSERSRFIQETPPQQCLEATKLVHVRCRFGEGDVWSYGQTL